MTRPIFEPTTQRAISTQGWGQRQLFRRPAPSTGTRPIMLRALRDYGTGLVVGTGVESAFILFDDWVNQDSTIYGETLSGGDLQKVYLNAEGLYTITVTAIWENNFAFPAGVLWLDDSTTASNWPAGLTPNAGTYSPTETADSFNYPVTMSITRGFPRYTTTAADISGGHMGRVAIKVIQYSAGNQDLSAVYLEIIYWGTATATLIA